MQSEVGIRPGLVDQIEQRGFAVVEDVVSPQVVDELRGAVAQAGEREEVRRKGGIYGIRNLFDVLPACRSLAASPALRSVVEPVLGAEAFAVRATLFDKIPGANWKLGWHQDSVITVREPRDVAGFGGFALKAGVWHVQPPTSVLEGMLAVRVHLDDCGPDNGPLRVLSGSHQSGWVEDDLPRWKREAPEVTCTVSAGGVVLMRPLLLHASSAAVVPDHRRVIHIEYAAAPLPGGLEWHARV
jgi:ectoine hydroxylase-related dioxygenase (phytanoyl-CoA dioxygenase family)